MVALSTAALGAYGAVRRPFDFCVLKNQATLVLASYRAVSWRGGCFASPCSLRGQLELATDFTTTAIGRMDVDVEICSIEKIFLILFESCGDSIVIL